MTKQNETELKEILSKFATIDGFLDCLKEIEDYAASTYIEENTYKHFQFNSNTYFTFRHLVANCYKIAFSYNNNLYDISFVETVYVQPSQEFARILVQEAKEIFERLGKELRVERELEIAYKIYKPNNKTKYVSELKDIKGVELSKEQIQKADKVFADPKVEDQEFTKINDSFYIKRSSIIAVLYNYPFGEDRLTRIILEGGEKIEIRVWHQAIFNLLDKCKKDFIKIGEDVYVKPNSIIATYSAKIDGCSVIVGALKNGGEIIFLANRYTADEIIEQLEKGCHE